MPGGHSPGRKQGIKWPTRLRRWLTEQELRERFALGTHEPIAFVRQGLDEEHWRTGTFRIRCLTGPSGPMYGLEIHPDVDDFIEALSDKGLGPYTVDGLDSNVIHIGRADQWPRKLPDPSAPWHPTPESFRRTVGR